MNLRLDTLGFRKKMKALRTMTAFYEQAPRDAAAAYQEGIVAGVINGQYVGVISGNLKRSVEIALTSRFSAAVVSDLSIAPYSPGVRKNTRERYGEDFYQIAMRIYGPEIEERLRSEWRRGMATVNTRDRYTYENPFP